MGASFIRNLAWFFLFFTFTLSVIFLSFAVSLSLFTSRALVRSLSPVVSLMYLSLAHSLSRFGCSFARRVNLMDLLLICCLWSSMTRLRLRSIHCLLYNISIYFVLYVPYNSPLLFFLLCSNYHGIWFVASVLCVNKRLMCVRVNCFDNKNEPMSTTKLIEIVVNSVSVSISLFLLSILISYRIRTDSKWIEFQVNHSFDGRTDIITCRRKVCSCVARFCGWKNCLFSAVLKGRRYKKNTILILVILHNYPPSIRS